MLTKYEMKRILEEEKFRFQIRQDLEKASNPKHNKVIAFLNTNLGIFILSSVVISLLTYGFTTYSNYLKDKSDKDKRIEKLRHEINNRMTYIFKIDDTLTEADARDIEYSFNGNTNPGAFNFYEEFCNRTIYSLLDELGTLEKNKKLIAHGQVYRKCYEYFIKLEKQPLADGVYALDTSQRIIIRGYFQHIKDEFFEKYSIFRDSSK